MVSGGGALLFLFILVSRPWHVSSESGSTEIISVEKAEKREEREEEEELSNFLLSEHVKKEAGSAVSEDSQNEDDENPDSEEDLDKNNHHDKLTDCLQVCVAEAELEEGGAANAEEDPLGDAEQDFNEVDLAIGCCLLGAVVMIMVMFWFVNNDDPDFRYYTWMTISLTTSIFVSVFSYDCIKGLIEYMIRGRSRSIFILASLGQTIMYFTFMQAVVWYESGMWDDKIFDSTRLKIQDQVEVRYSIPEQIEDRKSKMRCWAAIGAHMAAFASINLGGYFQHGAIFRGRPLLCFAIIPVFFFGHTTVCRFCFWLRCLEEEDLDEINTYEAPCDSDDDRTENTGFLYLDQRQHAERWARANFSSTIDEAERDIPALCVSFLSMQAIRFNVSGVMPNNLGVEIGDHVHAQWENAVLMAVCVGCIVLLTVFVFCRNVFNWEGHIKRMLDVLEGTCAMMVAWGILFYFKWEIRRSFPEAGDPNTNASRVILATMVTFLSFFSIYVLDKLADMDCTGEITDKAIYRVIESFGILTGFSWEQAFDGGTEAIAWFTRAYLEPAFTETILAMIVALIVLPAWRRYILSKVISLQATAPS